MSGLPTDFQTIVNAIVALVLSITGVLIALGKLRITKPGKNNQKGYSELTTEMPILNTAVTDIKALENRILELSREVSEVRADMRNLQKEVDRLHK